MDYLPNFKLPVRIYFTREKTSLASSMPRLSSNGKRDSSCILSSIGCSD